MKEPLVKVYWKDAWFCLDPEERDTYTVKTVGYLLENTQDWVVVAGEKMPEGKWRGLTHIPKEVVLRVKIL